MKDGTTKLANELHRGDVVVVVGRRGHPRRRHRHRGDRVGRRVGDHRRVGPRDPRVRRGPQRRHRRHARALGPDRRRDLPGAGPELPRPHDRARRGRRAAQDAERDRALDPARRPDARLPRRGGHAAALRLVRRHRDLADDADRAARLADPDDDRRAAERDRHRRAWTAWCAATCSRSPAARSRPPATSTCCCSTRPARSPTATGRRPSSSRCRPSRPPSSSTAARLSSLADETPEGRSIVELAESLGASGDEAPGARFVPFTAETRMSGIDGDGTALRKGAADSVTAWVEAQGGVVPTALQAAVERIAQEGGTPLVVARDMDVLGVIYLKDTVKDGHARALRPAARDGHPDGHGHRRQPAHRGEDRAGGGRRRLPRRGDARAQARADPPRAGGGPDGRDGRRRHQRRAGARAGRRRA